jgi:hypothetical protein
MLTKVTNYKMAMFLFTTSVTRVLISRRSVSPLYFMLCVSRCPMLRGVPVPTAWRVLGLRMEERPPDMEVSCEYIE